MQQSAKLSLLAGAALVSLSGLASAASTAACSNGTATNVTGNAASFVKNDFSVKCSKNVYLNYDQTSTQVGVCSASLKGSKIYGGNSEGGAVTESSTAYATTGAAATATNAGGC